MHTQHASKITITVTYYLRNDTRETEAEADTRAEHATKRKTFMKRSTQHRPPASTGASQKHRLAHKIF